MRKFIFWLLVAVGALGLFWMVDFPQTVRLKVSIVNLLPLNPEYSNSVIANLCDGAFYKCWA